MNQLDEQMVRDRIQVIDEKGRRLRDDEKDFIADLIDNPPTEITKELAKKVNRIFRERVPAESRKENSHGRKSRGEEED